jgi:hypothetical protein
LKGKLTWGLWLAVCAAAVAAALGMTASVAVAADLHAFNPDLSLTGDCSTSTVDEVPDPGPCPGVAGVDHPAAPFNNPKAVTTDFYGNIYVSSAGPELSSGTEGRIDVFDSAGNFITEIPDESGPGSLAVDSEGNLYVANGFDELEEGLVRYEPTAYEPATGQIEYGDDPVVIATKEASGQGLAINVSNDHLFRKLQDRIIEYGSATEDNAVLDEDIGTGELSGDEVGIAVDAAHGRIYASTWEQGGAVRSVKVFELAAPHDLLFTLDTAGLPNGKFLSSFLSMAVDEGSGHSFIYDGNAKKVFEFDEDGKYLSSIEHSFQYTFLTKIAVDNGPDSPNGGLNAEGRYLFVPSHPAGAGHSFAFGPAVEGPPVVESISFGNVSESEAELRASITPTGLPTDYVFEFISEQRFEEEGGSFIGAEVAGGGQIPAGKTPVPVAAAASGLEPGVAYRFRVVAGNDAGTDEAEGQFSTYPAYELSTCANDLLRTGPAALLPDCRAYELVTPPETNARSPHGVSHLGLNFATREASPSGDKVSFQIEGGTIPGQQGTGSLGGDNYLSSRGSNGWGTSSAGPNGVEAAAPLPGSTSPDQGYSLWGTGGGEGTAVIAATGSTEYVRYPDGHSALVGRGSVGIDPHAIGKLISENGEHIIFWSGANKPAVKIEDDAPQSGTAAIYDRTSDEITHVVSLLPGDLTPAAGQGATYRGASLDGRGVAFEIGDKLYLRYDDDESFEIGENVAFAGIAEGGNHIFYLEDGDLMRFDALTGIVTPFSTFGNVTPVYVSRDGSAAYFVSHSKKSAVVNPNGAAPISGKENLYRSAEGEIDFVGTVTDRDVDGEIGGNDTVDGLGLWTPTGLQEGRLGAVSARTTSTGEVLLFESRAALDGYDPGGRAEVYRYDLTGDELQCLSCNPTSAPATGYASLQSIQQQLGEDQPFSSQAYVNNLSSDGRRAFFQSTEALVPNDSDGLQDVYEWEAEGVGSCATPGGCVYLVSSGHSLRNDYIYAVSDSGDDVFFRTSDLLLPADAEETPSIYDARVGGGFPEPVEEECEGEGCRPGVTSPPAMTLPAAPAPGANDNVKPKKPKHCPKGKHKAHRKGKVVCVKKKPAKKSSRRAANANRKGVAR